MSLVNFVKGLVPNFDRSRILEDIAQQREYLNDSLIPNLQKSARIFAGKQMISKVGRDVAANVLYALPEIRGRGIFQGQADYFTNISTSLGLLEGQVSEIFAADVTKETLTYQKTVILKYLESSRFLMVYASHALNELLAGETAANLKKDEDGYLTDQLTKHERQWVAQNLQRFIDTLKALNKKPRDIITAVSQIPELTIDERKESVVNQTVGNLKLDPLRLGLLSPGSSPIYTLRMYIAEWQHANYKAGVEEARVLELRIQEMKYALEGKEDARNQKALDYTKGRLDGLRAKLKDYEDRGA